MRTRLLESAYPRSASGRTARIRGCMLLLLCCCAAAEASAQTALVAPVRRPRRMPSPTAESQQPAASESWILQTRGEVSMQTPVVRLHDVAMLVGPSDPHWERIGGSAIALLPTDGRRLSIERQRLADVLARHLAGQRTVHWVGPDLVSVRYAPDHLAANSPETGLPETGLPETGVPETGLPETGLPETGLPETGLPETERPSSATASSSSPALAPRAVAADRPATTAAAPADDVQPTVRTPPPSAVPLAAAAADRLIRLVQYAVDRADPTARDQYDIQIDPRVPALTALADARSIRLLRVPDTLQPGPATLIVQGDLPSGAVSAQLPVTFQPRPLAVFSTQSIRRGDRIAPQDVELRPLGRGHSDDGTLTDLQAVIGMEARNALHSGRPLSNSDVGLPIIVRRGDLVEVRVVGGSVTVRTSARALNDGSEGELLQVETQTPRRRLMARAVTPGVVEIITRPPQVGR